MKRVSICVIALLAGLAAPGRGQSFGVGKYAGEFLATGVGGRATAMGGAYVALATDASGGYWNPAALAWLDYPELIGMHESRFAGVVNYDYGAVVIPYGPQATVGLSVIRLGVDGIPDTRNAALDANGNHTPVFQADGSIDYSAVTHFDAADWAFILSYGKRVNDEFSYGANAKIIRRVLGDDGAFGIGFDAAALWRVNENLTLGANAMDITTTLLAWSTGTKELISPTLKLGGGYALRIADRHRVTPALDVDVRFENRRTASIAHVGPVSFDPNVGLEYAYNNVVAVRGGLTETKQFTVGAGVKLPKLNIDYTFSNFASDASEQLGATHRISVMVTLEQEKYKR